eukprot:m.225665 g.225665  ORF g.225665 m.225665 type:complete len:71 (+) comp17043_c0_seq6:4518-4730(+)
MGGSTRRFDGNFEPTKACHGHEQRFGWTRPSGSICHSSLNNKEQLVGNLHAYSLSEEKKPYLCKLTWKTL